MGKEAAGVNEALVSVDFDDLIYPTTGNKELIAGAVRSSLFIVKDFD